MKRLDRLLGIALLLSARRRLKGEELAEHFGVSLRTVYRDLQALQEAGFPVSGTAGDGYLLPQGSQLRPLAFDPTEAELLVMGARLLERAVDEELREKLHGAVAKLEAVVGPEAVRRLGANRSRVLIPQVRARREGPVSLILEAVREQMVVDVVYDGLARGETTCREIEPLGLIRLDTSWLIPAYCRLRGDLRIFRIDRIRKARATGERFQLRPGLTLEEVARQRDQEAAPPRSSRPTLPGPLPS